MKKIFILSLIIILLNQCADKKNDSQWRGSDRNGIYYETNLLKEWPKDGPQLLWKFEDLGTGYSSVVVSNKKVYITGMIDSTGYVYSFDREGKLLWKKAYGPEWNGPWPGTRSTPVMYKGAGYVISSLGVIYCFNADNGDVIWSRNVYDRSIQGNNQYGITENLLIDGNILYCTPGGVEENVFAIDRTNGKIVWKSKAKGEKNAYCSPIIIERGGNKYYIINTAKSVISINIKNGELAWSYDLFNKQNVHANTPIYSKGKLFVMDGFEAGSTMLQIAEDGKSVTEVWKSSLLDETNGHSVLLGENLYISAESKGEFCCINWNTGEKKYSINKYSPGTVISADGMLYCYSYDGDLGLLLPTENEFQEKGYIKLPKTKIIHISHPVINDGKLYVRHDKTLWAFNISTL